jgi:hypothetical protein
MPGQSSDQRADEAGGPVGGDLRLDWQVGPRGKRQPLAAAVVLISPHRNDGARRSVAGEFDFHETDMVSAPIHASTIA